MIKIFDQFVNELNGADIDPERGRTVQTNRIKPDAKPVDNITKFAYEDADYEDILLYIAPSEVDWLERRIEELKHNLANTDYCVLKMVEGVVTQGEYDSVIEDRKSWRRQINELETQLAKLKGGAL